MAEPAASRQEGANGENADAALALKTLALNDTVMDLTDELTRQKIRCEFVHRMGILSRLPQPLHVDQLELLIASMRGMTQQIRHQFQPQRAHKVWHNRDSNG